MLGEEGPVPPLFAMPGNTADTIPVPARDAAIHGTAVSVILGLVPGGCPRPAAGPGWFLAARAADDALPVTQPALLTLNA
ncbi:hypothetical protein [Streptomyces shenzhenensis]|uniref:hypothetical protein n=1 Tax=Streptomyces shenzhenensis TaxID=943815 RepID=UPI0033DD1FBC